MENVNDETRKAVRYPQIVRETEKMDHTKLQFTKIKPKVGKDEPNFGDILPERRLP